MTTNTNHKLDIDVMTVVAKMSKREASSLVRFLTDQIAESTESTIDVRIDLRNDYDGAVALITAGTSTIFGSSAVITDSHIRLGNNFPKVGI